MPARPNRAQQRQSQTHMARLGAARDYPEANSWIGLRVGVRVRRCTMRGEARLSLLLRAAGFGRREAGGQGGGHRRAVEEVTGRGRLDGKKEGELFWGLSEGLLGCVLGILRVDGEERTRHKEVVYNYKSVRQSRKSVSRSRQPATTPRSVAPP